MIISFGVSWSTWVENGSRIGFPIALRDHSGVIVHVDMSTFGLPKQKAPSGSRHDDQKKQ